MKIKLTSIDAFAPALEFSLDSLPAIVGHNGGSQVIVEDRWTSSPHCELLDCDGVLMVRDLSSQHGIAVNGARVAESELHPGDVLTVGIRALQVSYRAPRVRANGHHKAVPSTGSLPAGPN